MFSEILYLRDFQGKAVSSSVEITADGETLPNQKCRFVKISNWNVNSDIAQTYNATSYWTVDQEIYYGFGKQPAHQLLPGQSTELIPIDNLNQITLLARAGQVRTVWYTYFY